MGAEMTKRRQLHADIDRALVDLDEDGLSFVLAVALVRGMGPRELDRVIEMLRGRGVDVAGAERSERR